MFYHLFWGGGRCWWWWSVTQSSIDSSIKSTWQVLHATYNRIKQWRIQLCVSFKGRHFQNGISSANGMGISEQYAMRWIIVMKKWRIGNSKRGEIIGYIYVYVCVQNEQGFKKQYTTVLPDGFRIIKMINDPSKGLDADHCPFLGDRGSVWCFDKTLVWFVYRIHLIVSAGEGVGKTCLLLFPDPGNCLIHVAKPVQCSTWPFWPELLAEKETYQREVQSCHADKSVYMCACIICIIPYLWHSCLFFFEFIVSGPVLLSWQQCERPDSGR